MLRLLAALLLLSGVAFSQDAPPNEPTQPPARNERGTDQEPFTVKILPAPGAQEKADKEEHERAEKAQIDRKLAFETQRIADYTDRLALFTLFLVFVAMGQASLFVWQLLYMRQGLRDTQIAAIAAKDAANTQTNTFLATHRPRVRIKHVFFTDEIRPNTPLTVRVTCVNSGTTEATITEFGASCHIIAKDKFLPFPNPPIPQVVNNARYPLACGITLHLPNVLNAITLTGDQIARIRSGGEKLYCIGYLRYLDGANRLRSTGLCRVWTFPENAEPADAGRFRVVNDSDYEYED
jgi:hypothetical protein